MNEPTPSEKTCTKCGVTKPMEDFNRNPQGKFGRQSRCRGCVRPAWVPDEDLQPRACVRCGESKQPGDYYRDRSSSSGLRARCKACDEAPLKASRERVKDMEIAKRRADKLIKDRKKAALGFNPTGIVSCIKCGESQPIDSFHLNGSTRTGRSGVCKKCKARYSKIYYADESNRRANLDGYKRRLQINPERQAEIKRHARARRRARLAGVEQEPWTRAEVWAKSAGVCRLCDEPIDRTLEWPDLGFFSVDHILPISRGGADKLDNLQAAHLGCNVSKGNRVDDENELVSLDV